MIGRHRPRPRAIGRGTRLAALVAAVAVAAGAGTGCSKASDDQAASTKRTTTTTTAALVGTVTPTEAVIAGQCLDALPDPEQQTYAVLVIPCEDPHTYEVYAQTKLDTGSSSSSAYPGALTVANTAEAQCLSAFEQFMGLKWEESNYDIQAWWPSAESWTAKKDRTVLCGVYRVTGGTTKGTVRGTKQ